MDLTSMSLVTGELAAVPVGNYPIFRMGAKF